MRYIIGDIHGCYEEYREMLRRIDFSEADELYVLGDAMDRGPEPIKVIMDLMMRPNAIYILGNHDHMMLSVMNRFLVEITEENCEEHLTEQDFASYLSWMRNGGDITRQQFGRLTREEQQDVLEYLEDAFVYEVLEQGDKRYILTHAGIGRFEPGKALEEYDFTDFIWHRADYGRRYFDGKNTFLITGHSPTPLIREDGQPLVYTGNGHIALDCGCVFGGQLAAYCIETEETFYVKSSKQGSG